ncbi:MAG TPA: acetyltransferase [Chloroflexota bacterium]|nr:acetyltransferase [Chloroflexota bacterium]
MDSEPLATAVPDAALQAALTAYENARTDGLCHEGAWESALYVLHSLHMAQLVGELEKEVNHA